MSTRRTDEDFSAEVEAHLELEITRLIEDGLSPADARDAALRAFGNVGTVKERFYEANRWMWLEHLAQDLRYGWRGLRKSPAFVATTVLTLAVGLGLLTVVFTIFNAYVLRPFAVRDPGSLYRIGWRARDDGGQRFRWRDYETMRQRRDVFESVVAEDSRFVSSDGRTLSAGLVSDNYFEALGPRILLGRALGSVDARAPVAVLSQKLWAGVFAGDPAILGREIDLDGRRLVIVGVIGPEFTSLDDAPRDLWIPLSTYAELFRPDVLSDRSSAQRHIEITARLLDGVNPAQAQSVLTPAMPAMLDDLIQAGPGSERKIDGRDVRAHLESQSTPNPLSLGILAVLSPIFAAFGLVLVTACANVSSVMLSRAIGRQREIAVRLALGASRGRVIRQLLTEGLLIAVMAGLAGLALADWVLRIGIVMLFRTLPPTFAAILRVAPLEFDRRVFLFALLVTCATTLVFALVPAVKASRLTLTDALHGERTGTRTGMRLRGALVVGQVAVSLVLVVVALTLARNSGSLGAVDVGFQTQGAVSVNVRGNDGAVLRRLASVLQSDPRVAELAVTSGNPLFERSRMAAAAPAASARGSAIGMRYTFVAPGYFPLLRIPIIQGRGFREDEGRSAAPVAVVSAATARMFWPGGNPIGQSIGVERGEGRPVNEVPGYSQVAVVGVAQDVVSGMIFDGQDAGHIYLPIHISDPHASALLFRAHRDGNLGPAALQEIFRQAAPDPQVFEAVTLGEMRAVQMYPLRAASWVGTLLAGIALALSVTGLYGVLSCTLTQRTRNRDARMALGATAAAVVRLVMGQSARLAGVGAAIGFVVAFSVLRFLSSVIHMSRVSVLDAVAFAGGLALIAAATAFAAYQPARRATRVDPVVTLRADA